MKVKILKGNYFFHPPKKGASGKSVVVVHAGGEVEVSESEGKRLEALGAAKITAEVSDEQKLKEPQTATHKTKEGKNSKEKSENASSDESSAEPPPCTDDGDIVV